MQVMRRKDKEIRNETTIMEIVSNSLICRLGIFDDEYPYIVPLNYGYYNNALYFHCASEGKKIELLRKNNKVCFEIEQSSEIIKDPVSCNWTMKYCSVIGYGIIEIVSDHESKKQGLDIIMRHYGKNDNAYKQKVIEEMLILKLNIISLQAKKSV